MTGWFVAVLILQVITLVLVAAFVLWRVRFAIDVRRIADSMAANLLDTYRDDADTLSEQGVKDYARRRYIEVSASFGLPTGPADRVCALTWQRVQEATGEMTRPAGIVQAIYE